MQQYRTASNAQQLRQMNSSSAEILDAFQLWPFTSMTRVNGTCRGWLYD